MSAPVVATVGTTHPLAFAGLVFAALALADDGVRPVCVVAGISAQDATGVRASAATDPDLIAAQFAALADADVAAFHVGALVSGAAIRAVASGLARFPGVPAVIDPVLAASTGEPLGGTAVLAALRDVLLPLASLLTPNLDEAAALSGRPVRDPASMRAAAADCRRMGARGVLVKGGHLAGDAVDLLVDEGGARSFRSPRIGGTVRGSGDLLAASIAGALARGLSLDEAVAHARTRVARALRDGVAFAGNRVAPLRADARETSG